MTADLRLDDGYLEQLRSSYAQAHDVFSAAARDTGGIASVVGEPALESRVRDFYSGWDSRRTELIDALDALAQSVVTVAESFEQVDADLAGSASNMP
ncbi:hypothetical protein [Demequina aestuarii]|uniref:hypothetical protein n=1 Tax=Demequina aestuarii TaxID=327095 RepID=UPI0007828C34|nr:hypothetical protein [Demequina aestuarii]